MTTDLTARLQQLQAELERINTLYVAQQRQLELVRDQRCRLEGAVMEVQEMLARQAPASVKMPDEPTIEQGKE